MKVVIVGGVAGGASVAARLRRLAESAEVIMVDKGAYVSFANCGLPYAVSNTIQKESSLLIATPDTFKDQLNIDVRVNTLAEKIDRNAKTITLKNLISGDVVTENYDKLVLAPGAHAIVPPWPGVDLPGIFLLRTIPDMVKVKQWISLRGAKKACVVGGGFIGVEMAENLHKLGMEVTVVDMAEQVLPPFDREVVYKVEDHMKELGVNFVLGDAVTGFEKSDGSSLVVNTKKGAKVDADIVILSIGVRPSSELAKDAGLDITRQGAIKVDNHMRTSDADIFAVGDVVETTDIVTGEKHPLALAGPANRQGRVAASAVAGRTHETFDGVINTSIVSAFDLTAAMTGASETALKRCGISDYEKIYTHPGSHVSYFPNATPISIKLLFHRFTGKIYGAQAVSADGSAAARRIDVISAVIKAGGTVHDLAGLELCYSPQHGAAKDPVNLAGMVGVNVVEGILRVVHWYEDVIVRMWGNGNPDGTVIVDVRTPEEYERGHVEGSINIPYEELRSRINDVPKNAYLVCIVGQRAYNASRILSQKGRHDVRVLTGGMRSFLDIADAFPEAKKHVIGELWDPKADPNP